MKILLLVIVISILIGGFAGGEAVGRIFSILWGSVAGLVVFLAIFFGGAFFYRQDQKRKNDVNLTPEIRGVFDRITGSNKRFGVEELTAGILDLMEDDRREIAAGRIPDRRLFPDYQFKRQIILSAFYRDFSRLSPSMRKLNQEDFAQRIAEIRLKWGPDQIDAMIEAMKRDRLDNLELEEAARKNAAYASQKPVF